jgi:hypothetical protein
MTASRKIAFKYIAIGIASYVVSTFIVHAAVTDSVSSHATAGMAVGIFSAMIMMAVGEAYRRGGETRQQ